MRRTGRTPAPAPARPTPDLAALAKGALEAARAFEAQQVAFKTEMEAEEALLSRVLHVVRPALPAIVTLMPTGGRRGALVSTGAGAVLYLREDGLFVEASELDPRPLHVFPDLGAVLVFWAAEPIIQSLARLVLAQVTGRGPSTADARARAAKLTAIAGLLGAGP